MRRRYTLTVRHGSRVERERFDHLDSALAALRSRAEQISGEGPLQRVKMLREFEPSEQVHARLELSSGGLLRGREVGLDVMGDGRLVAWEGVVRRRPLEPAEGESPYDPLRKALADA